MVAKKSIFLKTGALLATFGVPVLLFVGFIYKILSPREWRIGFLSWIAALLLWTIVTIVGKLLAKDALTPRAEPAIALDDRARKRILREIWTNKLWIGLLVVGLIFGTANGLAQHAWLPTFVGVEINQSLMWFAVYEFKRRRKQRNWQFLGGQSASGPQAPD